MRLPEAQIEFIRAYLSASGIKQKMLQDDILDHLCCVLENDGKGTADFESRLKEAILDFAPNGLEVLERETVYLLNYKKLRYMKKVMYVVGLGSSISLAMGLCFKLLGWLGGYELLIYGFLSFTLLFMPMAVIDRLKLRIHKSLSDRLRFILGSISAVLAGIAALFKILHLQGADFMLLGAAVLFSFGFLPFLFFTNYRKAIAQHLK